MATQDPNIATQDPYNIQIPGQPPAGSPGLPVPPTGTVSAGGSNTPSIPAPGQISGGGTNTPTSAPISATQTIAGNTSTTPAEPLVPMQPPASTVTSNDPATPASGGTGTGAVTAPTIANPNPSNPDMSTAALTALMESYGAQQGRSASDLAGTEAGDAAYWIPKIQAGGPAQLAYWESRMASPPNQGANAGGGGAAGGGGGATGTTTMGNWTGTTPGQGTDLYNTLMARANQSEIIDPNDPTVRSQVDPAVAQLQRQNTSNLAADAERAGSNANIGAETRAGSESVAQGAATIEGQVMGQQLAARQQEIQQALSGAAGLLTNEQQMNLQEELAKLQLAQQQSQYEQTLGQNAYQFGTNTQLQASGL